MSRTTIEFCEDCGDEQGYGSPDTHPAPAVTESDAGAADGQSD